MARALRFAMAEPLLQGEFAMVETSQAVTLLEPEPQEGQPVLLTGIYFAENPGLRRPDLTLARYPTLIDEGWRRKKSQEIQFEPAFLLLPGTDAITVVFELDSSAPELVPNATGGVKCRLVDSPSQAEVPGLVENVLLSPRSCRLTWDKAAANGRKLLSLRIYCQEPADATVPEMVEGGLYLAIIDRQGTPSPQTCTPLDHPPGATATVTLLGFDAMDKPLYDLFRPDIYTAEPPVVPSGLVAEVAFRVRETQTVGFDLVLDPKDLVFSSLQDGQVEASPHSPANLPVQVTRADLGWDPVMEDFDPRRCNLSWLQVTGRQLCRWPAEQSLCMNGGQASFFLQTHEVQLNALSLEDREKLTAAAGNDQSATGLFRAARPHPTLWEIFRRALVPRGGIDPTVIQPPPCDPNGICIDMRV
jgi:hypothetical protein